MEEQSEHQQVQGGEWLSPLHPQGVLVDVSGRPHTLGQGEIMQDAINTSQDEEMLLQNLDYAPINNYSMEKEEETLHVLQRKSEMQDSSSAHQILPECSYEQLSLKLQEAMKRIQSSQHRKQSEQEKKRTGIQKQSSLNQPLNSYSKLLDTQPNLKQRTPMIVQQKQTRIPQSRVAQHGKKEPEQPVQVQKKQARKGGVRSNQEFIEAQMGWEEKKQRKMQEQLEKEKQMTMSSLTFTPQINQKSKALAKRRGDEIPLYQREAKPKKTLPDPECTFHPNIAKHRK